LIGPLQKKLKLWSVSPIWPRYIGEKGRDFGQTYGIKARCYWEKPLRNTLGTYGTHWEHVGNKGKMKKILLPLPPTTPNPLPKFKRKKFKAL
jgi:hypothetical protein